MKNLINKDIVFDLMNEDIFTIENYQNKYNYCKCGHEFMISSKFKNKIVCPICKNETSLVFYDIKSIFNYEKFTSYNITDSITFSEIKILISDEKPMNSFQLTLVSKDKILELKNKKVSISQQYCKFIDDLSMIKGENFILTNLKLPLDKIKKEYKYYKKEIETSEFFYIYKRFQKFGKNFDDFKIYVSYIYCKNNLPLLFNDTPMIFFIAFILSNSLNSKVNYSLFDYKKLLNYLNLNDFEEFLNDEYFYNDFSFNKSMGILPIENQEILNVLKYSINHYNLNLFEIQEIIEDIDSSNIEINDFFINFFKNNIVIFKKEIVHEYLVRLYWLKDRNYNINETNFKNYKFFKNMENLKKMKYPEKNINYIMDLFPENPLKAMELLNSKKELTKKQIDDIINILIK